MLRAIENIKAMTNDNYVRIRPDDFKSLYKGTIIERSVVIVAILS